MIRLASRALWQFNQWRRRRAETPEQRDLQAQYEKARKGHRPTRLILSAMREDRHTKLRRELNRG